jgi:hypothetical protein
MRCACGLREQRASSVSFPTPDPLLRIQSADSSRGALKHPGSGFRQARQGAICIGIHRHLTIRSSRPHVVASAMCFTLRLHTSAAPPRVGLTQALGAMPDNLINCCMHGDQGIGLVCIHAAIAIDSGESSGFFWSDNTDLARPDAWCSMCEQRLVREGWSESWFKDADFKILCAACWDLAKERLGPTFTNGT